MSMNSAFNRDQPWQKQWPLEDLESVSHCPVCGEGQRQILHSDLVDDTFRAASGSWTLWQCMTCRSAYLDPRPTQSSIHRAYASYYTHREPPAEKEEYTSLTPLRKLRRRLVNGYVNWRYGVQATPLSRLGVPVVYVVPGIRKLLDREYRHLPKLPKGGGRLLDVGCGDGSFLKLARSGGWDVVGLDPDPQAVVNAARLGLTVYEGDIQFFAGQSELFDVITLNHVIEHVFDPKTVLASCWSLLKPGGQVWVETPNIDSFGHARFQQHWRGLEAPRHLVLFNRYSLNEVLRRAGFPSPKTRACPSGCFFTYQASFSMTHGFAPNAELVVPRAVRAQANMAAFAERFMVSRREFLTVAAEKGVMCPIRIPTPAINENQVP